MSSLVPALEAFLRDAADVAEGTSALYLCDPSSPAQAAVSAEVVRLLEEQPVCARVVSEVLALYPVVTERRGAGRSGSEFNALTDDLVALGRSVGYGEGSNAGATVADRLVKTAANLGDLYDDAYVAPLAQAASELEVLAGKTTLKEEAHAWVKQAERLAAHQQRQKQRLSVSVLLPSSSSSSSTSSRDRKNEAADITGGAASVPSRTQSLAAGAAGVGAAGAAAAAIPNPQRAAVLRARAQFCELAAHVLNERLRMGEQLLTRLATMHTAVRDYHRRASEAAADRLGDIEAELARLQTTSARRTALHEHLIDHAETCKAQSIAEDGTKVHQAKSSRGFGFFKSIRNKVVQRRDSVASNGPLASSSTSSTSAAVTTSSNLASGTRSNSDGSGSGDIGISATVTPVVAAVASTSSSSPLDNSSAAVAEAISVAANTVSATATATAAASSTSNTDAAITAAASTDVRTVSSGSMDKPMQQGEISARHALLTRVHAVRGNTLCADCGANAPKWMSINLGCVLCRACASVHRTELIFDPKAPAILIGSVSHVIPIVLPNAANESPLTADERATLQPVTEHDLLLPLSLGNERLNLVLEHKCRIESKPSSSGSDPSRRRPSPDADMDTRRAFICSKYRKLAFTNVNVLTRESLAVAVDAGSLVAVLQIATGDKTIISAFEGLPHRAVATRKHLLLNLLLHHGCAHNAVDGEGNTPLHIAARTGARDCIIVLLRHGASVHTANAKGQTAAELAVAHPECVTLFQHGTRPCLLRVCMEQPESALAGALASWRAAVDPASKAIYFFHVVTNETSWTLPMDIQRSSVRLSTELDRAARTSAEWDEKADGSAPVPLYSWRGSVQLEELLRRARSGSNLGSRNNSGTYDIASEDEYSGFYYTMAEMTAQEDAVCPAPPAGSPPSSAIRITAEQREPTEQITAAVSHTASCRGSRRASVISLGSLPENTEDKLTLATPSASGKDIAMEAESASASALEAARAAAAPSTVMAPSPASTGTGTAKTYSPEPAKRPFLHPEVHIAFPDKISACTSTSSSMPTELARNYGAQLRALAAADAAAAAAVLRHNVSDGGGIPRTPTPSRRSLVPVRSAPTPSGSSSPIAPPRPISTIGGSITPPQPAPRRSTMDPDSRPPRPVPRHRPPNVPRKPV